jgi:hypothetical protein
MFLLNFKQFISTHSEPHHNYDKFNTIIELGNQVTGQTHASLNA